MYRCFSNNLQLNQDNAWVATIIVERGSEARRTNKNTTKNHSHKRNIYQIHTGLRQFYGTSYIILRNILFSLYRDVIIPAVSLLSNPIKTCMPMDTDK
jgi:hypothetical protein